jgi:Family of unknown function (DUF5906)
MNQNVEIQDAEQSIETSQGCLGTITYSLPNEESPIELALRKYYYGGKSGYAMQLDDGSFIPLSESQVRQHLNDEGVPRKEAEGCLCQIRTQNYVVWMGNMAGHPSGVRFSEDAGDRFLVLKSPTIIPSNPGKWPTIKRIVTGLFDDPAHPEQLESVLWWMKAARENVIRGKRVPLPALAMIGPRACGKTLFTEIVRLALGGRAAAAYRAFTGETDFNAEIIAAELLLVDDEIASKDSRTRSAFAQGIKSNLFASSMRVEAKGQTAFNARPVHALVIALNDGADNLRVLPELDDGMRDKILLIKANQAQLRGRELKDRDYLAQKIREELPAFLDHLEKMKLPRNVVNSRTRTKAFQHPEILTAVDEISPEHRLFELIQQHFEATKTSDWEGTAAELEGMLKSCGSGVDSPARSLIKGPHSIGGWLGKLAAGDNYPIQKGPQKGGIQTWEITLPKWGEKE